MQDPRYPSLYQVNTRVWLTELSRALGRPATLDDVPDAELDRLAEMGFDWVWFLSVWRTGLAGQQVSRSNAEWRRDFEQTLPDLRKEDIAGSGFAITGYSVHPGLGGEKALVRLRQRLARRGLKLMLDFVPNHTGLDHWWVNDHPEYYVPGTELDLARAPKNYTWVKRTQGDLLPRSDRHDPVMTVSGHERRYLLWRSSAAPKKAAASDKIAFARASSRFSLRNAVICARSSSSEPGGAAGHAFYVNGSLSGTKW